MGLLFIITDKYFLHGIVTFRGQSRNFLFGNIGISYFNFGRGEGEDRETNTR